MSYQVIARKWRPQTFADVTGQEPITRTLRNAIEHERLHHAYLFSGARGVGKTTTARLLAKALNCHKATQPTPTPCAFNDPTACASCQEIAEGRSMDVLEIDAASNTGVDNVREAIIGNIAISAARDRYKVFIIDEVHMLSGAAFNALLKTLEEPPSRVLFVLATTEKHKLPETILSRCQQFEFRTIATAKIAERLRLIARAENVAISETALREVARAGEGSMRDAQSAFDQVISFSTGGEISPADVETALGLASRELLARVTNAIGETRTADILLVVDDLVMRGYDLRNFCRDLLAHLRDLLVVKVSDAPQLLDASAEERTALLQQSAVFSETDLTRFFHALAETETSLKTSPHPRYQLEIGLVKLAEMRRLAPLSNIIERLSALENSLRDGHSNPGPASSGSKPTPVAPAANPAQTATPPAAVAKVKPQAAALPPAPESAPPPQKSAPPMATPIPPRQVRPDDAPPFAVLPPPAVAGTSLRSVAPAPPASNVAFMPPAPRQTEPPEPPWPESRWDEEAPGDDFTPPLRLVPPASPPRTVAAPSVQPRTEGPALDSQTLLQHLKTGLERQRKLLLAVQLESAHNICAGNGELVIEFLPEHKSSRDSLGRIDHLKLLREICLTAFGQELAPRVVIKTEASDSSFRQQQAARMSEQQKSEQARNHPAVQEVITHFGGTILEIKPRET